MVHYFIKHKKILNIFIYIVLALIILNLAVMSKHFNNEDSLNSPTIFSIQHQFDIPNVEQVNKISPDKVYSLDGLDGLFRLILCNKTLIQNYNYAVYKLVCLSVLFLILQWILLPRNNSSKYKASLISFLNI